MTSAPSLHQNEPVCIAVDAMGGDKGPQEVVRGVCQAAAGSQAQFVLVGAPADLQEEMARSAKKLANVRIEPAMQVIEMGEAPAVAFRKKPDASLVVAARMVRQKKADAFISIGNTGGAMVVSLLTLGRIPGIDRPAIATPLPTRKGGLVVLLDAGATVDCTPENLYEFALMGSVYAERVLKIAQPRVAILSNGEEDIKGNDLVKRAHALFRQNLETRDAFCFVGNAEGRDVFSGEVDVVACDGFVGNIALKTAEGVAEMTLSLLREELTRKLWSRLAAAPLLPLMRGLRRKVDYAERGGAPLLGVNGVCIIGHGRSNAQAVANACRAAEFAVRQQLVENIKCRIGKAQTAPFTE